MTKMRKEQKEREAPVKEAEEWERMATMKEKQNERGRLARETEREAIKAQKEREIREKDAEEWGRKC